MPDFHSLVRERLRNVPLSGAREAEIVDEMAGHLSERYEQLLSAGNSEADAMATVVAELGGRDLAHKVQSVEPRYIEPPSPEGSGLRYWWAGFLRDVHYGLRVLRLSPGFTSVCVLSLALGIGANTAIFQLIDAVRMRTLPVRNPQELVVIRPADAGRSGSMTGRYSYSTNPMWEQVRTHQEGFDAFAWGTIGFNLVQGGEARYAEGLWVSGEFFQVLGIQPLLGRVLQPADDHPGCGAPGAVISYGFWQREFGGNAQVIGKPVSLFGHPFPVLGVTPADFYGLEVGRRFDVAVPICSEPVVNGADSMYNMRHAWWLAIMARLKPGISIDKASAQLSAVSPSVMQESLPPVYSADRAKRYLAMKLAAFPAATGLSNVRRNYETPLWLLLAIAGLVLLIACANLANLMLARAGVREREIAIRLALGARRSRLVRQLLTESLLLGFAGAAIGIALAGVLSRLLINYLNGDAGHLFVALHIDWRVLGFTAALGFLTCILFGLAPALRATSAPPARVMSLAGRGLTIARERFGLRRGLVVMQVALSLVLLVTALLFVGTVRNILNIDAGFQRDGILAMDVDYTILQLPIPQRMPYAESLLQPLRALPGTENLAETDILPLGGNYWNDHVIVDGKLNPGNVNMSHISSGYFKTMGTPLLAGRDFDERDNAGAPHVAIVNQQFARKILQTENPIGRTYKIDVYKGQAQVEYQIVGLVKDTKYAALREDFTPIAYYPQLQATTTPDPGVTVVVRSSLPLESLLSSLRQKMSEINPAISISFRVLNKEVKDSLLRERLMATLSGFFGLLATVLATIGLYGVIAYVVVRRTNEIGIRMALGATPVRILAMILREGATLLVIGLVLGAGLSLAAGRAAAKFLFGLSPRDPLTLVLAALLLSVVAVTATLLPARRAAHLEPTIALREE